jgi:outer membrane scaffolding protein for murein synthesis (MipA/OmpV family)
MAMLAAMGGLMQVQGGNGVTSATPTLCLVRNRRLQDIPMRFAVSAVYFAFAVLPAAAADPAVTGETSEPWLIGITVGGFAGFAPEYEGSDEFAFRGIPLIAPRFSGSSAAGRLDFRGLDDIRFALLRYQGLEAGPLAGYRFERDDGDVDLINGIGDVDGGLVVGG